MAIGVRLKIIVQLLQWNSDAHYKNINNISILSAVALYITSFEPFVCYITAFTCFLHRVWTPLTAACLKYCSQTYSIVILPDRKKQ